MKHQTSELTGAGPTAMASLLRSAEAESIHWQARRAVDEVERRNGPMPAHESWRSYRFHVARLATYAMRQELLPLDAHICTYIGISGKLGSFAIPPELQAHRDGVLTKWQAVVAHLHGTEVD